MFPKVPQAENAYLALYYHPGAIHKKWWRRNFAKLNNFSGIAMADRGCDRIFVRRDDGMTIKSLILGKGR